jgi:hypothetical protein
LTTAQNSPLSESRVADPERPLLVDQELHFSQVLIDEMKEILGLELPARPPGIGDDETAELEFEKSTLSEIDSCGTTLGALCLSGGGIRSATFALGVMQGLARYGLLDKFHYLSSVSGGGYIASWLSRWRSCVPDAAVMDALNQSLQTGSEPRQIKGLREDSNYLTPQLGLLSADTWTVFALYLRNLLLNWILFLPFFLGCLAVPRLCAAVLEYLGREPDPLLNWAALNLKSLHTFNGLRISGGVLAVVGLACAVHGRFCRQGKSLTDGRFQATVLLPLVISGTAFSTAAMLLAGSASLAFAQQFTAGPVYPAAIYGAVVYLIAWVIGRATSWASTREEERKIQWRDVRCWTYSGVLVGLLVRVGMTQIAAGTSRFDPTVAAKNAVIFGLSWFMLAYLAGELLYVGLASFSVKSKSGWERGEMDREWLARSSGWLAAVLVGCAAVSTVALYGPFLLGSGWRWTVVTLGGLSGIVTFILGNSALTGATQAVQRVKTLPLMRIASGAAIIFAVLLATGLSWLNEWLEAEWVDSSHVWLSTPAIDFYVSLGAILFSFLISTCVNVNRFSMHALYRNRLIRAFLGSGRTDARQGDPFTGFDPKDNLPLAEVVPVGAKSCLFHVINTSLNVVSTKKRAWQERKAESFTMTRLHCGNQYVHYRRTAYYGGKRGGGLSLGTAMAISGAAVSPNQGYNSSPLIGFLLTLFNVRLGWWLGNPNKETTYSREGPNISLLPALRELAGATNDKSPWIYLSDGGHFENLGLYEMVKRRCRRIVVSDAGCDPTFSFEDLGNAVRKIYIDLGVSIKFDKLEIKARQNPPVPGIRFAIGTIDYPGSDIRGWLLYLKPTYLGTERADVRSYASGSPTFPHESTTDQWFSESQLESYRALGASIAEYVCSYGKTEPQERTLDELMWVTSELFKKETRDLQKKCCGN